MSDKRVPDKRVEEWKEAVGHGASTTIHQLQGVAQETKKEFGALWQNADERDDLLRTLFWCVAILIGVSVLVIVTGWMPLWARLLVIFLTLGILGRWLMSKISDSDG